jgi:hypothetical protein
MDSMKEIPLQQFISYCDENNNIYGFDLISLHNLILKSRPPHRNPYTRDFLPKHLIDNMEIIMKMPYIFGKSIIIIEEPVIDLKTTIELRTLGLFQEINGLGNYTDHTWLLSLKSNELIKFIKSLMDIWDYRANLSMDTKKLICPPHGTPFSRISVRALPTFSRDKLLNNCNDIIREFIHASSTEANKCLGVNYILCALTLVSKPAAISMPWFYQSVA